MLKCSQLSINKWYNRTNNKINLWINNNSSSLSNNSAGKTRTNNNSLILWCSSNCWHNNNNNINLCNSNNNGLNRCSNNNSKTNLKINKWVRVQVIINYSFHPSHQSQLITCCSSSKCLWTHNNSTNYNNNSNFSSNNNSFSRCNSCSLNRTTQLLLWMTWVINHLMQWIIQCQTWWISHKSINSNKCNSKVDSLWTSSLAVLLRIDSMIWELSITKTLRTRWWHHQPMPCNRWAKVNLTHFSRPIWLSQLAATKEKLTVRKISRRIKEAKVLLISNLTNRLVLV